MAFIPVADAISALRAAGHCVTRTTRADAARRYGCPALVYVVDGSARDLCTIRQMALDLRSLDAALLGLVAAEPVAPEPVAPEPVAPEPVAPEPVAPEPVAPEPVAARPVLPGESLPPAPPAPHGAAAPVLPPVRTSGTVAQFRTDAMAGRPISLAGLARALAPEPVAPEPVAPEPVAPEPVAPEPPTGKWMAGQPWDPGTPEARSKVAIQQHRVGILWPISQALRGQGLTLPPCWLPDGPVMAGEWPLYKAMAALPLGAISTAATALAALPPVTADQAAALELCDRGAVTGCPWL